MPATTQTDTEEQQKMQQLQNWAAQLVTFNGDNKKAKSVMGEKGNHIYIYYTQFFIISIHQSFRHHIDLDLW